MMDSHLLFLARILQLQLQCTNTIYSGILGKLSIGRQI